MCVDNYVYEKSQGFILLCPGFNQGAISCVYHVCVYADMVGVGLIFCMCVYICSHGLTELQNFEYAGIALRTPVRNQYQGKLQLDQP